MAYISNMTARVAVAETPAYLAKAERIMDEAERWAVVDTVSLDPLGGVLIPGSGGLRKMRVALHGRGKRGGGRVIYWFHSPGFPAVLLWAFAKNEAADLSPAQKAQVKRIAERLIDDFGG